MVEEALFLLLAELSGCVRGEIAEILYAHVCLGCDYVLRSRHRLVIRLDVLNFKQFPDWSTIFPGEMESEGKRKCRTQEV